MTHRHGPNDWDYPPLLEHIYPLANADGFAAIDIAVCNLVDRLTRGQGMRRVVKDGLIVYDHVPIGLYMARIAVLQITPTVAEVQLDLIGAHRILGQNPSVPVEIMISGTALLQQVDEAVARVLRAGVTAEQLNPPMPPVEDVLAVLEWHRLYHPNMPEEDLAERLLMNVQSLANARTKFHYARRLFRERLTWEEMQAKYPIQRFRETPERRGKKRW